MSDLNTLQQQLGYSFVNAQHLRQALRHRSMGDNNNERLEFLGDAILGLIITEELYRQYPAHREGDLSRMRAMLVNGQTLSELAIALTLPQHLTLGAGEQHPHQDYPASILADAMEAVIGALYLDGGYSACQRHVLQWFQCHIDNVASLAPTKDPKSLLQEWCQSHRHPLPRYDSVVAGPDHQQVFTVRCQVEGVDHQTSAKAGNRRKAEQKAAQLYWEWLHEQ